MGGVRGESTSIRRARTPSTAHATRSVDEDFAFLDELESLPWFAAAPRNVRTAIVVKLIRIHLFDAIFARAGSDESLRTHRDDLLVLVRRFGGLAPGVQRLLSIADRAVIDRLAQPDSTAEDITSALAARQVYLSPATLIPRNPARFLSRQGPFRTLLAGYQVMRRG